MTNSLNDLEEEVLGTALITTGAMRQIVTLLPRAEAFQSVIHQAIYEQMLISLNEGRETDLTTIHYYLTKKHGPTTTKKHSPKEQPWMVVLTSLVPAARRATGSILHKCGLLQQEYVRIAYSKQLANILTDIQDPTQDALALMDKMRVWLDRTTNRLAELSEKPFATILNEVVDRAEEAAKTGNPITGIASNLTELDAFIKGFHPGTMTILAGRPGMGKTAVACQIAHNIAIVQRIPVAFFSLEMTPEQMAGRALAIDSGVKNSHVTAGVDSEGNPVNIDRLRQSARKVGNAPISIYDKVRSLPLLKARISQFVSRYGDKVLVIVDYLQLVKTGERSVDMDITARVSEVSREIKEVAIDYHIPVLALAQLNREVEKRKDKRPMLSDLNHSGSLEQDADTVIFLYSPGYYKLTDKKGLSIDPRLLYGIIAKNRHGSVHKEDEGVALSYNRATNQVKDYQSFEYPIQAFEKAGQLDDEE